MSRLRTVDTLLQEFPLQRGESAPSNAPRDSEDGDNASTFQRVLIEEVHLGPESRVVFHTDPRGPGADRFRYLRMRLRKFWEAGKLKSIMITSALPQDGKSTISLNLACALSEQGKRKVLLIEADLHHPTLIEQLGLKPWPGLAECIEKKLNPWSGIRRVEPLGFHVLPAGSATGNPTEILHPDALAPITHDLYPNFDWVLVDAPPLAPLTDALALARHVDGSLLVVRAGRTPRADVEQAVDLLGSKHVIGIVLNGLEGLDRVHSKYYGYYGKSRVHGKPSQPLSNDSSSID